MRQRERRFQACMSYARIIQPRREACRPIAMMIDLRLVRHVFMSYVLSFICVETYWTSSSMDVTYRA
jgi:hypothetical protein